MSISKRTVNEMLRTYLEDKDLEEDAIESVMKSLHKDVKKKEEDDGETSISHGTSCPRLSNKEGDLLIEM